MRPSALRPQQTPPREPELAGPFPPDLHDVRHLWLKAVLLAVWVLASFVATYFARDLQDIVVVYAWAMSRFERQDAQAASAALAEGAHPAEHRRG